MDGRSLSLSLKDGKQIPLFIFRFCIASQAPFRSRVYFWVPKGRVASASSRGWDSRRAGDGEYSSGIQVERKQMQEGQSAKEMQTGKQLS